jgi:transcriptional regulator with XRE-family HTH domain
MINGELIRKRRKELKMSQNELAEGITSQGMISQIETRSSTPSGETLEKIVTRLNLSFAEAVETDEFVDAGEIILAASVRLIHQQYEAGSEFLEKINDKTYIRPDQQLFLEFTRAWIAAHSTGERSDTIFTYNKILQEGQQKLGVLWPLVASGLGYQYLCEGQLEAASYYTDLAVEAFQKFDSEKYDYAALTIWTNASFYYLETKQYEKAIHFAQLGIDYAQKKLISGPVDILYCNLAFALAGKIGKWTSDSIKALYMAYTFSDHTNNAKVHHKVVTALDAQGFSLN